MKMKWNRWMEAVAVTVCAWSIAGAAAVAQVSGSSSSSEYTVRTWNDLGTLGVDNGSFVVDRFGTRDGRLVAYGRLVPSDAATSSLRMRSDGTIISTFDVSALGGWTGRADGYGESGRESRSSMMHDYDRPASTSMSLVRPFDDEEAGVDLHMGPTSGNDRTSIDAKFGPTSGNDRTLIDLKFGPTSGNDRVAGGPIDLKMGPTSGNDRTSIDAKFGPTSGNDRTSIDLKMGPTSANDRTALSATSSIVVPVDVVSASCDAVTLSFGGSSPVTLSATTGTTQDDVRTALCAVSSASTMSSSDRNVTIETNLNRLIGAAP
jgi:hypothetical protein